MRNILPSILLLSSSFFSAFAQAPDNTTQLSDTTFSRQLDEVVVEGNTQQTNARVTTYIPTAREKQSSQNGVELIEQMGIPQLMVVDNTIQSNSGKQVAVFIDFIPASSADLQAMRMADVRKVEYYESPSDPRLQGNQFVVNYIMAKYEYGGYLKGSASTFIPFYSQQILANARLQYKKMTYDVLGFGWNSSDRHSSAALYENYRIPQLDDEMMEFKRISLPSSNVEKYNSTQATFRASYNSDKIQAVSMISGNLNNTPRWESNGTVEYFPAAFPSSAYSSMKESRSKSISYYGYYFFSLPKNNSLKFNPKYSFSHTETGSTYSENGFAPISNGASDNTNSLTAQLRYGHNFGKNGNFGISADGLYNYSRTEYSGSRNSFDRARTYTILLGTNYDVTVGNFYGYVNIGYQWYKSVFSGIKDINFRPWADVSLQYGFKEKHSVSAVFHYSNWPPSANYKSDNIIHATPMMYYTGNPLLTPFKSFDWDLRYTWFPSRNYSFSAFIYAWNVSDRYVYCYEPYGNAIIRTIRQPLGGYAQGSYGFSTTLRFLNRSLVLTGRISQLLNHNGKPYSINHSSINWYARLRYYIKNWNFTLFYSSPNGSPDGCMVGIWVKDPYRLSASAGWSNDNWNIRLTLSDFTRWNYHGQQQIMRSQYYDTDEIYYSSANHARAQLSVTYTFGFGKKVKQNNELSVSNQTSSGILKN